MTYVQRTICPYDCPTSCGLLAETDGKKILRVKGDKTHPANKGLICGKMQHYEESINSEKRILTPLRRTGKKGSGQFMPITWEEAGNEIAERFLNICREDGPQAILPAVYSGVMGQIQRKCGEAFFNRLGACSLVLTLCASAKGAGYSAVAGKPGVWIRENWKTAISFSSGEAISWLPGCRSYLFLPENGKKENR